MSGIETGTVIEVEGEPRFVVGERIDEGGMGVVFRARDLLDGIDVAIKTLKDADPDTLSRLKTEFQSIAGIQHRNLIDVMSFFELDDVCFFTMELLEGVDFVSSIRAEVPDGAWLQDASGLSRALRQLVDGLTHLHSHDKIHRDIKPGNVLVCPDGRVVLLDLGLTAGIAPQDVRTSEFVGSEGFTAPEQVRGEALTTASDWFSVGCLIYQCFSGLRVPRHAVHQADWRFLQPIDEPYRGLIQGLLAEIAADRSGPDDILAAIDDSSQGSQRQSRPPRTPFVGRIRELGRLQEAWRDWRQTEPLVVTVHGASGIGKTATVDWFLRQISLAGDTGKRKKPLVLAGRCHPREVVRFRGMDAVITDIGRLGQTFDDVLSPHHAAALVRLFPVMRLSLNPEGAGVLDLQETRRLGLAALRLLIGHLSEQRRLVIWLDDLQWVNRESLTLISELLQPPYAPAIFLILSFREHDFWEESSRFTATRELSGLMDVEIDLPLSQLSAADSRALALSLLGDAVEDREGAAESIAASGEGSPFIIQQMVASWRVNGADAPLEARRFWSDRVAGLSAPQRVLLETVCIAGRPIAIDTLLSVSGVDSGGYDAVRRLCDESWLALAGRNDSRGDAVYVYHDQLREEFLSDLSIEEWRRLHKGFADSLRETESFDPQELVGHYLDADERELAGRFAVVAARASRESLAFEQAAELFQIAHDTQPDVAERWRLLADQAECLGAAGRNLAAAGCYDLAAESLAESGGSDETLEELRTRATAQRLFGGELDLARADLEHALKKRGVTFSRSPVRLGLLSLLYRYRFRLRWMLRHRLLERAQLEVSADETEFDVLKALTTGAALLDHLLFDVVSQQWLNRRLDCPDPEKWIVALSLEAARQSTVGGNRRQQRAEKIITRCGRIAGRPMQRATLAHSYGVVCFNTGKWERAEGQFTRAFEILANECVAATHEMALTRIYLLGTWAHQGKITRLRQELPELIRDAETRNDLLTLNALRTSEVVLVPLADDRPDEAMSQADEVIGRLPRKPYYSSQHYHYLIGMVKILLYRGEPEEAWATINGDWKSLQSAYFLAMGSIGVLLRNLMGLSAANYLRSHPDDRGALRRLKRMSREIRRQKDTAFGQPMADALDAAHAAWRGNREVAETLLERAIVGYRGYGMDLHVACAQLRLGDICGGEAGETLRRSAQTYMQQQQIRSPECMARVVAPALPDRIAG